MLLVLLVRPGGVLAQQVDFGLFAEQYDDIALEIRTLEGGEAILDFGSLNSGSGSDDPNATIVKTDDRAVVLEIEGVAYLDVTVTLTPPLGNFIFLSGNEDFANDEKRQIPINVKMAYFNRVPKGDDFHPNMASGSTEVVGDMATFQIRRRPGGPPGPPPTPPHAGYTPPTAKAYLIIYGDINVGNVNAGPYSGIIDVHVEYSGY